MFKGLYNNGRQIHPNDQSHVLKRALTNGINRVMVTAGSLSETKEAIELVATLSPEFPEMLSTTIGVHPTRCNELEVYDYGPGAYMRELLELARQHNKYKIKAIGEFGLGASNLIIMAKQSLDYDRIKFCAPETQRKYFEQQFILADETGLPLFLHMRDAAQDFIGILRQNRHRFKSGVVHSFTGTANEARQILELDLLIGINGCSLKTKENLEIVRGLPIDKLMVESDAPWCEIRPSHAGYSLIKTKMQSVAKEKHDPKLSVKSRNEPLAAKQVLECISALHELPLEEIANRIFDNSVKTFG